MTTCLFCDLIGGQAPAVGAPVYEDELVYASNAAEAEGPSYLGHLYVLTKRHVRNLADVNDAEAQALGLLVARLCRAIKECTGAEHAYAEFYAEVTPHVHILVTARYAGTPPEFWRWRVQEWPGAPRGTREEVAALAIRLRDSVDRMVRASRTT
jgi:diadenosine tetraphosphate (Ap4A) HIT family hydrolase